MTRKIIKGMKEYFVCDKCSMAFKTKKEADKCEERHATGHEDCHDDMIKKSRRF